MQSEFLHSRPSRPVASRSDLRPNRLSGASAKLRGSYAHIAALLLASAIAGTSSDPVDAAENATSWYVLGLRGPGSGLTPPPGFFLQNDFYVYRGDAGLSRSFPLNGRIAADLKGKAYADFLTGIWVTPFEVFGGRIGISVTEPYGGPEMTARAGIVAPRFGRTIAGSVSDSASFFGDPIVSSFIGWDYGKLHWQVGTAVNMPYGTYDRNGFTNISFHRWTADTYASFTWLDPELGIDLSTSVGVTFNGVNHFTDYHTGDEFHIDAAATKYLSKEFSVGLLGYYYQQITADSGQGATLGAFKGRVAALGGTAAYTFQAGPIPISTRIKVFREFDATNRLQHGTVGFLTVSMPLWVPSAMPANEAQPVKAKY